MIMLLLGLIFGSWFVWGLTTYIVKKEPFRTMIIAFALICAILYIMDAFGIKDIPLPR